MDHRAAVQLFGPTCFLSELYFSAWSSISQRGRHEVTPSSGTTDDLLAFGLLSRLESRPLGGGEAGGVPSTKEPRLSAAAASLRLRGSGVGGPQASAYATAGATLLPKSRERLHVDCSLGVTDTIASAWLCDGFRPRLRRDLHGGASAATVCHGRSTLWLRFDVTRHSRCANR